MTILFINNLTFLETKVKIHVLRNELIQNNDEKFFQSCMGYLKFHLVKLVLFENIFLHIFCDQLFLELVRENSTNTVPFSGIYRTDIYEECAVNDEKLPNLNKNRFKSFNNTYQVAL